MSPTSPECPVCGSDEARHHLTAACPRRRIDVEFNLLRCLRCSMVFLPRSSEVAAVFPYNGDYEKEWGAGRNLKQRVEHLLVKRLPVRPPGRLLDVGCGTGSFIADMERKGWEVSGIDPYAHQFSRDIHPAVLSANLHDADLPAASFDVVTSWWAIEHVADPVSELVAMRRLIKPGGLLAVATCNVDSWWARLFGRYWRHLTLPEHVSLFSPRTLSDALRRAGFAPFRTRQIPITADAIGGLEGYLAERGLRLGIADTPLAALGMPLEALSALLRASGLFVILARPA